MFVASEASKVTSFEQARGKRLALPPADSLARGYPVESVPASAAPTR